MKNLGTTQRHARRDGGLLGRAALELERLKAENAKLRDVVEQAVVLYEMLRSQDEVDGDIQGENFWLGHRETAQHALGVMAEAEQAANAVLGRVTPRAKEKG